MPKVVQQMLQLFECLLFQISAKIGDAQEVLEKVLEEEGEGSFDFGFIGDRYVCPMSWWIINMLDAIP